MPPAEAAAPVDLATKRAAVTRQAIRDAVVAVLETEHPAAVSVPEVARRAGVSVRTVYRYYPNKHALLDEVANIQFRQVAEVSGDAGALFRDPNRWVPVLWRTFSDDIAAVRAQHRSSAGADLRDRRLGQHRVAVADQLRADHPAISEGDLERLVDGMIAVTSSAMFLELHDRMGWDVDEAAELSLWMVDAMRSHVEHGGTA